MVDELNMLRRAANPDDPMPPARRDELHGIVTPIPDGLEEDL